MATTYEVYVEKDERTEIVGPVGDFEAATKLADVYIARPGINPWDVTIHDGEGNVWACSWTLVKK